MIDREADGSDSLEVTLKAHLQRPFPLLTSSIGFHVATLHSWWYRVWARQLHPGADERSISKEADTDLFCLSRYTRRRRCGGTSLQQLTCITTSDAERRFGGKQKNKLLLVLLANHGLRWFWIMVLCQGLQRIGCTCRSRHSSRRTSSWDRVPDYSTVTNII